MKSKSGFIRYLFAMAFLFPLSATAADWKPSGNMTMIVASSPGGAYDVLARAMSKHWVEHFGVKLIVQNVAGAGGSLGLDRVMQSKPDGRTLGFMSRSPYLGELLDPSFPWRVQDIPLILAAKTPPYVTAASVKSTFKTWDDVRTADRPVRLAVSSRLSDEVVIIKDLLEHGRQVNTGTLPITALITALQAGDVDLWTSVASETLLDPIAAGHVRPLVTLDGSRYRHLPDVPSLTEVGMPERWKAVNAIRMWFAPIGTPPEVITAIRERMTNLLDDPAIKDWAKQTGFVEELVTGDEAKASQEELYRIIKDNYDIYKKYGG